MAQQRTFQDLPGDVLYLIMRQIDSFPTLHSFLLVSRTNSQVFEFHKGSIVASIAANQFAAEAFEFLELSRPNSLAVKTRRMFIKDTNENVGAECKDMSREKKAFGLAEAKRIAEVDRIMRACVDTYEQRTNANLTPAEKRDMLSAVYNMYLLTASFKWERDGSRINGLYDYTKALQMTLRSIQQVMKVLRAMVNPPPIIDSLHQIITDYNKVIREVPIPSITSPEDLSIIALHTLTEKSKTTTIAEKVAGEDDDADVIKPICKIFKSQYVTRSVIERWPDRRKVEATILIRTPLRVRKHPPFKQVRRDEHGRAASKRKSELTIHDSSSRAPRSAPETSTPSTPATPSTTMSSMASTAVSTPAPLPESPLFTSS